MLKKPMMRKHMNSNRGAVVKLFCLLALPWLLLLTGCGAPLGGDIDTSKINPNVIISAASLNVPVASCALTTRQTADPAGVPATKTWQQLGNSSACSSMCGTQGAGTCMYVDFGGRNFCYFWTATISVSLRTSSTDGAFAGTCR